MINWEFFAKGMERCLLWPMDTAGINSIAIKARWEELERNGYDHNTAFRIAACEVLIVALRNESPNHLMVESDGDVSP